MKKTFEIFFYALLTLSFSSPLFAAPTNSFSIISSTADEIILELIVPPPEFKVLENDQGQFYKVKIPGYQNTAFPGKPELPVTGQLVGVRDGREPVLEILETDNKRLLPEYSIYPALMPVMPVMNEEESHGQIGYIFFLDKRTYETSSFLYQNIAEIGFVGYMRDQKVAQIKAFPLQYNPVTKELIYYSRIRIKLSFHPEDNKSVLNGKPKGKIRGKRGRRSLKGKTGAYERVLKGLLVNYEQIRN